MNTHLEEYLEYFKGLDAPGYAVLVTGDWGVGKTYQVRNCLSENEHYYVSLFGLTSADKIHAAILAEMYPSLANMSEVFSGVEKAAEKAGGLYSILGAIAPETINAVLRRKIQPDKPLVFDDLERSCLELKDLLGVINIYVEQYKFQVIVITHDDKLEEEFKGLKEKLFGQTILVTPQANEAFDKFVSGFEKSDSLAFTFIKSHRNDIIRLFDESGAMSLRVLRHVIEDLGRLHGVLSEDNLANAQAMTELVCLFCALNIEVRMGRLGEDELKDRTAILAFEMAFGGQQKDNDGNPPEQPKLCESDDRYPSVNLDDSNLLNDNVLFQMLIEGRYPKNAIQDSLNNSTYFQKPEDAPPWKIIWEPRRYDDAIVEAAAQNMQRQFDKREVTEPGEMLHVFSLRMMMSEEGLLEEGCDKIVMSCKAYIDDLLDTGKLSPWGPQEASALLSDSFGGYGYSVENTYKDQFKEIYEYLLEARKKALGKQLPAMAEELLKFIKTDGQQFFEQVCYTNNGENPYVNIPILGHIEPRKFVDAWLGGHPENWNPITLALQKR